MGAVVSLQVALLLKAALILGYIIELLDLFIDDDVLLAKYDKRGKRVKVFKIAIFMSSLVTIICYST